MGTIRFIWIGTPGLIEARRDVEVLEEVISYLGTHYQTKGLLSGVIYLHSILGNRIKGSDKLSVNMFKKLCGEDFQPSVLLATTMWDFVDPVLGAERESSLYQSHLDAREDFCVEMIKHGAQVGRCYGTSESGRELLSLIIDPRISPKSLQVQRELIGQGRYTADTSAGMILKKGIHDFQKLYEKRCTVFFF